MKARKIKFLFCGGFGEARGLEKLIKNWYDLKINHELHLLGKSNNFSNKLKNSKISKALIRKKTLFFPSSVLEDKMVDAMKNYDIGIIPYEPVCINNKYCCPNKLSQYMKAGLGILSNNLPEIKYILQQSKSGVVCNFNSKKQFNSAIIQIQKKQKILCKRGLIYFKKEHHWQKQSRSFYRILLRISKKTAIYKSKSLKISYHFDILDRRERDHFTNNDLCVYPLANSRQLMRSAFCLFLAKCLFAFQKHIPDKKIPKLSIKNLIQHLPYRLRFGIMERFEKIKKKTDLSPF